MRVLERLHHRDAVAHGERVMQDEDVLVRVTDAAVGHVAAEQAWCQGTSGLVARSREPNTCRSFHSRAPASSVAT